MGAFEFNLPLTSSDWRFDELSTKTRDFSVQLLILRMDTGSVIYPVLS